MFQIRLKLDIRCIAHSYAKPKDSMTDAEKRVADAAANSNFDVRDSVGQMFTREHNKGSESWAAYSTCAAREAKKKSREEWLELAFEKIKTERLHATSFQLVDTTKGTFI